MKVLVYKYYCFTFDIRESVVWIFNISDISHPLHMHVPTVIIPV